MSSPADAGQDGRWRLRGLGAAALFPVALAHFPFYPPPSWVHSGSAHYIYEKCLCMRVCTYVLTVFTRMHMYIYLSF